MAFERAGEALQVVPQQEAVDEVHAMAVQRIGVPRDGDGEQEQPAPGIQRRLPQPHPSAAGGHPQEKGGSRHQGRHRPLDQQAHAHPGIGPAQRRTRAGVGKAPQVQPGQHQQQVEQAIGGGRTADGKPPQGRDRDHAGQGSRLHTESPRCKGCERQRDQPAAQRRGQPEGELLHPEDRHAGRLQPVDADGLVEAVLAVEGGVAPVAAGDHFAGGLGEGTLVDVEKRCLAQAGQHHDQQRQRVQPPRQAGGLRRLRRGCARTRHGSSVRPSLKHASCHPAPARPRRAPGRDGRGRRQQSRRASATRPGPRW